MQTPIAPIGLPRPISLPSSIQPIGQASPIEQPGGFFDQFSGASHQQLNMPQTFQPFMPSFQSLPPGLPGSSFQPMQPATSQFNSLHNSFQSFQPFQPQQPQEQWPSVPSPLAAPWDPMPAQQQKAAKASGYGFSSIDQILQHLNLMEYLTFFQAEYVPLLSALCSLLPTLCCLLSAVSFTTPPTSAITSIRQRCLQRNALS
jgi:hypothetical protein